jgi:hypothetical protein
MSFSRLRSILVMLGLVVSSRAAWADDPVHMELRKWLEAQPRSSYLENPPDLPPNPSSLPSGSGAAPATPPPHCPTPTQPAAPAACLCPTQPSCQVRVVQADGKARLVIQAGADVTLTCECTTLIMDCRRGQETVRVPVKLSIAEDRVCIECEHLHATASRFTHGGPGGCVTLEGDVKLKYVDQKRSAQIAADEVVVDLADGRLEIKPAQTDKEQVFGFWLSFFR